MRFPKLSTTWISECGDNAARPYSLCTADRFAASFCRKTTHTQKKQHLYTRTMSANCRGPRGEGDSTNWEDLSEVAARVLVPGVTQKAVTDLYNQWAHSGYDKSVEDATSNRTYQGQQMMQQAMQDLFPANRDAVAVLEVGAGTGLTGKILRDMGFKVVDGLDPAAEMLRKAQEKQVYRHTFNCYLTGQPTAGIAPATYDAVVMVGVMGHSCLPCAAFEEITRIIKPGGFIVNCLRKSFLKEVPDYVQNWEPLKSRMEGEGRWKVLRMDPYPNHFIGKEGLLMVIQVLES